MRKKKDKTSISDMFKRKYDPFKTPPMEYAQENYPQDLVDELKRQKKWYLITAGGGMALGVVLAMIGANTGNTILLAIGLGLALLGGYLAPHFTGSMWITFKKAYDKSEAALRTWEINVGGLEDDEEGDAD